MLAHLRSGVECVSEYHEDRNEWFPHLRVSRGAFDEMMDEAVVLVADMAGSDLEDLPDEIVPILKGGFEIGQALCLAFDLAMAAFGSQSYVSTAPGDRRKMQQASDLPERKRQFERDLLYLAPGFGRRILIVDDLTETCWTIERCLWWIRNSPKYRDSIIWIKTLVLWYKHSPKFKPDFAVDDVVAVPVPEEGGKLRMPWIDMPAELRFAASSLDDIRARVAKRQRS